MEVSRGMSTAYGLACAGQGGEALPSFTLTFPRHALSAMRSRCEPSASVRGLSFDVNDPSLNLGFKRQVLHSGHRVGGPRRHTSG